MKNRKAMSAGRQGFTLVELLISISIIAILSVVLTVSFSNAQKSSRDQRRIEDLKAIQNAAEQYYLLNGSKYPTNIGVSWTGPGNQMILQKFPVDPKNVGGYVYTPNVLTATDYCICAKMENSKNGNSEDYCGFNNINCNSLECNFCVKNQQ